MAWPSVASTAVAGVLGAPSREASVVGSTRIAAYLAVPGRGTDGPSMLALLAPGAVRLPIGMCSPEGPLPVAGSTVLVGGGVVTTPGGTWRPVRWWDPRPRLRREDLLASGGALLCEVLQEPPSAFGLPPAEAVEVARALAAGDPVPAVGVIGRGPGLTPAGDDVVAGALAVLAVTGRVDPRLWSAVRARAATHTTMLSGALLSAARRGQVVPAAGRLLAVIAAGRSRAGVRAAVAGLFAVGSTSGHDLALGMAGALAAIQERSTEEAA